MSGQISKTPILTGLSDLLHRSIDVDDKQRARRHVLDWLGCVVAGAQESAGQAFLAELPQTPSDIAFAWGGLGNILEMDDVDKRGLLHPGPSIVPAALAQAQASGANMESLLEAIIRGYEATIRLGRAVGPSHYAMWHSTGTCASIGAAAACSHLRGHDSAMTAHAMALAVSQSAGLWHTRHDPKSMGKQLHTAVAARAGLDAARLVGQGVTGPLRILEGEQGFFQAMCVDGDPDAVLSDTKQRWAIHTVSFKPWPACRHAHAVIDAALELRERVNPDALGEIRVATYADALKFCDNASPKTVIEAKFSLQHSVAVALARGAPSLEDFGLPAIRDERLAAQRGQVSLVIGSEFQDRYPARFGASVSGAGETIIVEDALGDPENPVTDAQILAKADMLMAAGHVSEAYRRELTKLSMEGDGSIDPLFTKLSEAIQ